MFKDKAGNLHQAGVRYGSIIGDDGKLAGGINGNGDVTFNKYGQSKFNVDEKLDIKTTADAVPQCERPNIS